jgi:hypothetical protein
MKSLRRRGCTAAVAVPLALRIITDQRKLTRHYYSHRRRWRRPLALGARLNNNIFLLIYRRVMGLSNGRVSLRLALAGLDPCGPAGDLRDVNFISFTDTTFALRSSMTRIKAAPGCHSSGLSLGTQIKNDNCLGMKGDILATLTRGRSVGTHLVPAYTFSHTLTHARPAIRTPSPH